MSDEQRPLISVVVPVYGVEKYLDACVESLLHQTYENLDVILVDDGSPDRCGKMCDVWARKDMRVRVLHQGNAGSGPARNAGLSVTWGDFITFVDPDDWLLPEAVETMWQNLARESADISAVGTVIVQRDRQIPVQASDVRLVMDFPEALKYVNIPGYLGVVVWGKLYRKSLFKGVEFPRGRSQDLPVTYELLERAARVVLDPAPLYCYRQNTASVGHTAKPGSHEPTTYTGIMLRKVRVTWPEFEPLATWAHVRRAVWDYQLLVTVPKSLWSVDSHQLANYVQKLLRSKIRYLRGTLATEPLADVPEGEYLRWLLIAYVPWLFRPLYRLYLKARREHAD